MDATEYRLTAVARRSTECKRPAITGAGGVQAAQLALHRFTDRGGQSTYLRRKFQAIAEDQGGPRGDQ